MNPLELGHSRFSYSSIFKSHTIAYYIYLNFQNKNIKPSSNASPKFVVSVIFLFFNDIGRNPIMADDATMSSNLLIVPKRNELEEAPVDLKVSQQPCEKELIKKVVHTKVVHFVWDHQMLYNPFALAIHLKLVPTFGNKVGRFDEC
jgi:hypothetical protein